MGKTSHSNDGTVKIVESGQVQADGSHSRTDFYWGGQDKPDGAGHGHSWQHRDSSGTITEESGYAPGERPERL